MEEKFNYVKRGYDPTEVDYYISTLESVLKGYKEKDNAIKNAIINAQIAADNIIKNAEIEADKIKGRAVNMLGEINNTLAQYRIIVKDFHDDYNLMIQKYIHQFNDSEILKIYSKINELEDYVAKLKSASTEKKQEPQNNMFINMHNSVQNEMQNNMLNNMNNNIQNDNLIVNEN